MSLVAAVYAAPAARADEPANDPPGPDPDPTALVQTADAIRFPRESFETEITVTNFSSDMPGDVRKYQVMSAATRTPLS